MLQAFLVLPGFALVYLVAGPPRLLRRCWQLLAGGAALLAAAGWWVAIVMLTPAADRPYVGGSTNDSILQLALGYNGLGRLDGNETGSVGPGAGHGGSAAFSGAAGLTRLFAADMGGQISWLLPAALISLAGLLWLTWRRPRTDRLRAAALLWGGWLLITGLVFSYMNGIIHPYYTVALAPAIAALVGMGAVTAWRARSSLGVRLALAAGVLVTAWWAYSLLDRSASWLPWLRVLVVACGLAAAAVIVAEHWVGGPARTVLGAVLPLALLSGLAGPLAYSLDTAATAHTGALPSAGPSVTSFGGPGGGFGAGRPGGGFGAGRPGGGFGAGRAGAGFGGQAGPGGSAGQRPGGAGGRTGGPGGLAGNTQVSSAIIKLLTSGASGYRWAAATVGAESAAPFQLASREPIMAIGGFNGTDAAPSLAEFKDMVAGHEIHYFIGANSDTFGGGAADAEAITTWVSTHFSQETAGGETVYNLAHSSSS
jgi:4-amino-4-deoxy-L-arabinose transferase-like glycosyltransferase